MKNIDTQLALAVKPEFEWDPRITSPGATIKNMSGLTAVLADSASTPDKFTPIISIFRTQPGKWAASLDIATATADVSGSTTVDEFDKACNESTVFSEMAEGSCPFEALSNLAVAVALKQRAQAAGRADIAAFLALALMMGGASRPR